MSRQFSNKPIISDGIHRATTRKSNVGQAELRVQRSDQVKERFFIHRLHRAGNVAVPILERIFRTITRSWPW